jgi:hypothetical protein
MAIGQAQTTQMHFSEVMSDRHVTAFTPPGLYVEAAKYPILMAGVLASTEPSEWLSIYDHPESWRGLDRDAILSMRKRLFRFTLPIDGRAMEPLDSIEMLQRIALSVSPIAIEAKATTLPPGILQPLGGQLPASPPIFVKSIEIVSEPEISRVAKRITEQDIPAAEASWKLLDYEYSLDQVARLMSVGLLGRLDSRRFVPTRGAYKAIIDSFINRSLIELAEKPTTSTHRLFSAELFGDSITILAQSGEPEVDYLRIERTRNGLERGASLERVKNLTMDSKTAVFADHARFSAYDYLIKQRETAHLTIFHFARSSNNNILGPWPVRAAVRAALESNYVELDSRENTLLVLKRLLTPDISVWTKENSLFDDYSGAFKLVENSSPRTRLSE